MIFLIPSVANADEIRILDIERIKGDFDFPVALCLYNKETILYTEKDGRIRVIKNGILQKEPLKVFDVARGFEMGLLGIACKDNKVLNTSLCYHRYILTFIVIYVFILI